MAKNSENTSEAKTTLDDAKVQEQGFIGVKADPTPNEAYTVQGVTSGAKTPETDQGTADAAAAHSRQIATDGSL